jgi:hypothetical protein
MENLRMVSAVAERLRAASRARCAAMTPGDRFAEALALGRKAITAYAAAHRLTFEEARRRLERGAQRGRRPSRVMDQILG